MKICQSKMLKTCHIENDPFIGMCKVYECKVINLNFPCMFNVKTECFLKDACSRCEYK